MKLSLIILLLSLLSSSTMPIPDINKEFTLSSHTTLNQSVDLNSKNSLGIAIIDIDQKADLLDFGENTTSNPVNAKKWSYCSPSLKVPYTGIKLKTCGSIEVGYVYIEFCGGVSGLNKCKTFDIWNSKADCTTLYDLSIYVAKGWVEVCPYNLSISKKKISTDVKFKLCGQMKFPWIGKLTDCTTFYSQKIDYKF
jgi:hypothetical protein